MPERRRYATQNQEDGRGRGGGPSTHPKQLTSCDGPDERRGGQRRLDGVQEGAHERALGAELSHHLGYALGAAKPEETSNQRNGTSGKTVLTDDGALRIEVPCDRDGSFEPLLIPKHERRFTGFDDKIVAMYARGMTMREIQGFLAEQYGVEISPQFISSVTEAVMAEVSAWQGVRSSRSIRWSSSMPCGSRSVRTLWFATRPSTWPWACCRRHPRHPGALGCHHSDPVRASAHQFRVLGRFRPRRP